MTTRGWFARTAALTGVAIVLLAVPGSAQAPGGATSSFTATASARLISVDFRLAPTIGFDPLLDPGQSVAQAQLDSLGVSNAYAANSYPGATVLSLPPLISFLLSEQGVEPPMQIPDYPVYASSSYPSRPEGHVTAGLYDLTASSDSVSSTAKATDGATASTASVSVDPATGDVSSLATSTVAGIRFGDALTVHGVRSSAEVRQSPSGKLERHSSFEMSALTILGQRVAVTRESLAAGTGLLGPLLAALAERGITIEVFPAQKLADGVMSAGLHVTMPLDIENLGTSVDRVKAVFTLGGVIASVSNRALPSLAGGAVSAPSGGGGDFLAAPSIPGEPSAAIAMGEAPAPVGAIASSGIAEEGASLSGEAAGARSALPIRVGTTGFYPVLVLAGAALFAGARLFSYFTRGTS